MSSADNDPLAAPEDPTQLAQFGRLEVVARLVVEGYLIGQHKSPFKGSSVEFVEHRQYYPGDEIRHIDWRAYGKTGKYFIKEFEEETNLRCYLVVDASGSMAYAGRTLSKFAYARQLAAAMACLLLRQRDAVALATIIDGVRDWVPPSTQPQALQRIMQVLEGCQPGEESSLAAACGKLAARLKRRSLVMLFSDCFDTFSHLKAALTRLRHDHHEVVLFQTVAVEEEEFPFTKATQFQSLERPIDRILCDPVRLRSNYLEQYHRFCRQLEHLCTGLDIDYLRLTTATPYHEALGRYLAARSARVG